MEKKKIIMMGIRKITMLFEGLSCEVSVFNRMTKETVAYMIGTDGVVREKPNQKYRCDKKCFLRAYSEWSKYREKVFA